MKHEIFMMDHRGDLFLDQCLGSHGNMYTIIQQVEYSQIHISNCFCCPIIWLNLDSLQSV